MHSKITALSARLKKKAEFLSYTRGNVVSADDLYQEMVTYLIGREDDEFFFAQNNSFIVNMAEFTALHVIEKEVNRQKHVAISLEGVIHEIENDGDDTYGDLIPEKTTPIEDIAIIDELKNMLNKKLDNLNPQHAIIVKYIFLGYEESEIAAELKVSRSAISQTKKRIASALGDDFKASLMELVAIT